MKQAFAIPQHGFVFTAHISPRNASNVGARCGQLIWFAFVVET
jgi:hypothetical protein